MTNKPQTDRFPPGWVYEDLDFAAALYLLGCPRLADVDPLSYVDRSTARIDWGRLLEEAKGWSHGERLLVQLACDLFGSSVAMPVSARELAVVLDGANLQYALDAIALRAGLLPVDEALADLEG